MKNQQIMGIDLKDLLFTIDDSIKAEIESHTKQDTTVLMTLIRVGILKGVASIVNHGVPTETKDKGNYENNLIQFPGNDTVN